MIEKIDEGFDILVAIFKVALPTREEVGDSRAENRPDEDPFEGLLAIEHVVEDATHCLVVAQIPVVAQFGGDVKNVVELAELAD